MLQTTKLLGATHHQLTGALAQCVALLSEWAKAPTPKFNGGVSETVVHPAVVAAMLLAMVLFFALPRSRVVVPLLFTTFLIPLGQQFYIGGVHLFIYRLLILVAFIRAMISPVPQHRSRYAGGWNTIDTAFTGYVVISAVATLILYPGVPALINQVGYLWDYLLGYFVLRSLIQTRDDSLLAIKCIAILTVLLGTAMVVEQVRMINLFGLLGGVDAVPEVREGKIRSQAVFAHALTAGAFGATAIPLFLLLWNEGKAKLLTLAGVAGATVMTLTTQTSTSPLTYISGIVAVLLWPLRKSMRMVRVGLVASVLALQAIMKAPVWFVIAHIDLTGSSSNYHRADLINQFVNHFSSWWLIGTRDAYSWGLDMWDVQNMYVSTGEAGGLAALICFVLVISRSYSRLGHARRRATSRKDDWLVWFLGAALFANVVAFFGVNYFDQIRMLWFALISMICACTAPMLKNKRTAESPSVAADLHRLPSLSASHQAVALNQSKRLSKGLSRIR